MANVYFGLNYGQQDGYSPDEVTEGASSTSGLDIEVRVATPTARAGSATYWTKSEIIQALQRLQEYVADGRTAVFTETEPPMNPD